jgi:dolichyl-phosphate beta-glucosyltransferase
MRERVASALPGSTLQADKRASLSLVIPVYNGAAFLAGTLQSAWGWLSGLDREAELLVVDDGSSDATPQILAAFGEAHPPSERVELVVLRNARNRGKGFSVRRAFLHARRDLVVFTDADLTYPIENLEPLVKALEQGADVAFGSRMHKDSRYVVAPSFFGKLFTRHFMGRVFNLLVRSIVVPGIYDSQAGLKGFRRQQAQALAGRVKMDRFSFDVELLFVARRLGMKLEDCPVRFIYRKEPSTVRFVRDSLAMLRDMLVVRWRNLRGIYQREPDPALVQDLLHGGAPPVAGEGGAVAKPPVRSLEKSG